MITRAELNDFYHDSLKEAVRRRYLRVAEERRALHLHLADYFESQYLALAPGCTIGRRIVEELPWQLAKAECWPRLSARLIDARFFASAWDADEFEVMSYWSRIETESSLRLLDAYRPILDEPAEHADHAPLWGEIAQLLGAAGHYTAAVRLVACEVESTIDGPAIFVGWQTPLAVGHTSLRIVGAYDEAMALHMQQEQISRNLGDERLICPTLINQVLILNYRGSWEQAMASYAEAERLSRKSGDVNALVRSLGNQAEILMSRGDLDRAMDLYEDNERSCLQRGDKEGLQASIGNQAVVQLMRGDPDAATALLQKQERICREIGYREGLSRSLGEQALVLFRRDDLDGAAALFLEVERLCRELGLKHELSHTLVHEADILERRGDPDGALPLFKEAEGLCRELGNKSRLSKTLAKQALILEHHGDLDGAIALLTENERIYTELGDNRQLAVCIEDQQRIRFARSAEQSPTISDVGSKRIRLTITDVPGMWDSVMRTYLVSGNRKYEHLLLQVAIRLARRRHSPERQVPPLDRSYLWAGLPLQEARFEKQIILSWKGRDSRHDGEQ